MYIYVYIYTLYGLCSSSLFGWEGVLLCKPPNSTSGVAAKQLAFMKASELPYQKLTSLIQYLDA